MILFDKDTERYCRRTAEEITAHPMEAAATFVDR